MQEISRGKKCVLSINIAKVGAVQNAVKIDTHIISPSGVISCVANGYDELKKVVVLIISGDVLNEVGAYSIDLRVVFADSVIIVPTFAFAEVVESEVPCYDISEVYVSIEGGEVVPSGNTTTIVFVNREEFEQLSNKVDELEEQIGSGGDSITIDTELSETSNNAIANGAVTKALKTKQDTLTLTTKDNGNIVIGNIAGQSKEFMPATPSGDPMHYAYEACGAVWNANTGYWEFYDMTDITNEQMSKAFARGSWYMGATAIGALTAFNEQSISAIRFNIARTGPWSAYCDFDDFAQENKWIEFINLTFDNNMVSKPFSYAHYLTGSFNGCSNLRRIYGEINVTDAKNAFTDTFKACVKLEDVEIYGLTKDVSFADSPNLSKESLLYMINNSASNATFTIVLHPDVHAKCELGEEWYTDINNALTLKEMDGTYITLGQ